MNPYEIVIHHVQRNGICVVFNLLRESVSHQLLKLYPDIAFAPDDIQVLIETPEKAISGLVNHATWQVAIEQEQANKDWPGYGARR